MNRLTAEEIQVLYDIMVTIKGELDLQSMLSEFLNVFLRKLNSNAGAVYSYHHSSLTKALQFSRVYAIPRNPERSADFREIIESIENEPVPSDALRKKRIIRYETSSGAHGYLAPIQKYGFIVFTKHGISLNDQLLFSLGSVFDRLGIACKACEHAAEIEQSRKKILQVNALLSERTVELEQSRESLIYLMRQMKRKEIELMDSEFKYRSVFENIQDVFYRTDISGIITDISPSIFKFSGYTMDEIIGRHASEFYSDKRDREKVRKIVEQNGEVVDYEVLLQCKNGLLVPTSLNAHLLRTHDGIPIGMEGSLRDISVRKKAEYDLLQATTRLRNLIEHLEGGILVEDEHRTVVLANQAYCKMFGLDAAADQLQGVDCSKSVEQAMYLFEKPDELCSGMNALLLNKEIAKNSVLRLADGRVFERDYIPVYVGGDYRGHIWHYRDISNSMMDNEGIRDINKQIDETKRLLKADCGTYPAHTASTAEDNLPLEDVNRLRSEFVPGVPHELRTAIASIRGFTETILRDSELDISTRSELLDIVKHEGLRLSALIGGLQDITHLESGAVKMDKSKENLCAIVSNAVMCVSSLAAEKSIHIVEEHESADISIVCNSGRLTEAIVNIVSNSIKLSLHRTSVFVRTRKEGDGAFIEIEDQGPGIPIAEREKVFERFYRVNRVGEHSEGAGLGLAIVRRIMELHRGTVTIGGEVGKGAIFTLYIPRNEYE